MAGYGLAEYYSLVAERLSGKDNGNFAVFRNVLYYFILFQIQTKNRLSIKKAKAKK